MSQVLENIKKQASLLNKNIVLPEGEDSRVVKAAALAAEEGLATVTLLGNPDEIKKNNPDVCLAKVNVVDPVTNEKTAVYAEMLYKAREGKINKKTGAPEYADVDKMKNFLSVVSDRDKLANMLMTDDDIEISIKIGNGSG